jgi:hypothetical protein
MFLTLQSTKIPPFSLMGFSKKSDLHQTGGFPEFPRISHVDTGGYPPCWHPPTASCPATLYKVGTPNCSFRHAGGLWSR